MSKTEPTTVQLTICPYGDLKLSIQTSTVNATYLVSSHQLGCASAVFRASLGPSSGFTEAINLHHSVSDDLIYEMRIAEELGFYPAAMAVVLYVIHAQLQHVPGSIGFKNLLDIAIIYDHYECAEEMVPWDKVWMKPCERFALKPGYEDWLFIAYVFGNQELFGKITHAFARNGVIADNGKFGEVVDYKVRKMHSHLPEGITCKASCCIMT